jgi:hypothetical protein
VAHEGEAACQLRFSGGLLGRLVYIGDNNAGAHDGNPVFRGPPTVSRPTLPNSREAAVRAQSMEGGKGTPSKVMHFQIRPDTLAK